METASVAAEVQAPVRALIVTISLRTNAGEPVRVLCEQMAEHVALEIMEALPGERPAEPLAEGAGAAGLSSAQKVERMSALAPRVIEAGCSLTSADGAKVRPAFHFTDATAVPGSLPGSWLSLEDKANLTAAVMQCSGFGGGAAPSASFPPQERGGPAGRMGVAPALARGGKDRVGDAPRPAARVQPRGHARAR